LAVAYALFELGHWSANLLAVATGQAALAQALPTPGGPSYLGWLLAAVVLLLAHAVARAGAERIGGAALAGALVGPASGVALLIFAGIASKGFGLAVRRDVPFEPRAFGLVLSGVTAASLPAVLGIADWQRLARAPAGRFAAVGPLAAVLMAVVLAFVG